MRLMRLLMTVLCSVLWIASAEAQTCLGQTPLEAKQMRAGGEVSFSANTFGVGGGVSKNFDQFFAGGGVIIHSVSGAGSGKGFFGGAGLERKIGPNKKYSVCPLANLFLTWGVEPAPGIHISSMLFNVGGMVGFEWMKAGNTQLVPTFGFSINVLRNSYGGGGVDFSSTNSFGVLQAGMGFLLNDTMSVVPILGIDLGSDSAETVFSVVFSKKLGKK